MDAYEMATAVNVIGKLPADFYDKLVSLLYATHVLCLDDTYQLS